MSEYPFITKITVDVKTLIPPYNHVHHADILKILEQARAEFLLSIGIPLEDFLQKGLFWVLSGLDIRYLREVKAGLMTVTCEQSSLLGRELAVPQKLYLPNGKLAVEANIKLMLFNAELKRAIYLPDYVKQAFFRGES